MYADYDAECKVLSGMLDSDSACVQGLDSLKYTDFTDKTNRDVFMLIESLYCRGMKPTYLELAKEGQTLGLLDEVGIKKISHITRHSIEQENLVFWVKRVKQAMKEREANRILSLYSEQIKDAESNNNLDIDQIIADASNDLFALAVDSNEERIDTASDIADLGIKLLTEQVEKYRKLSEEARKTGQVPLSGVPTGLPTLDRKTLGLKPGDLAILGAQTGHGKTAFALNVAKAACVDSGNSVLYINTEMSREQIAKRWGAIISDVALYQIQSGSLTDEQQSSVIGKYNTLLRESLFYSCSIPNLTAHKLDILTRKAKMQKDIQLVILDYVGRMEKLAPGVNEWQVLEQIIKSLKLLGQNLGVACLALVQLNPDGALQGAKRMENESDLLLKLLPMDAEGKEMLEGKMCQEFEEDTNYRIFVQKARDAEGGISVPLVFDKSKQTIREAMESKKGWAGMGKIMPQESKKTWGK